jgi:hypothetical protein
MSTSYFYMSILAVYNANSRACQFFLVYKVTLTLLGGLIAALISIGLDISFNIFSS